MQIEIYNNELFHFGTKGQKWGIRRYQNEDGTLTQLGRQRYGQGGERSKHGRSRDLNKLDDEKVNSDYYNAKYTYKANKREAKLLKKGKDTKYDDKLKEYRDKAEGYRKLSKRDQKFIDRIIKDSLKKDMSVVTTDIRRSVEKGKNATLGVLSVFGMMGATAVTGYGVGFVPDTTVPGTKYKVKADGKGEIRKNYRSTPFTVVDKTRRK